MEGEQTEEEMNEALRLRYKRMSSVKDPKITIKENLDVIVVSVVLVSVLLLITIFAFVAHFASFKQHSAHTGSEGRDSLRQNVTNSSFIQNTNDTLNIIANSSSIHTTNLSNIKQSHSSPIHIDVNTTLNDSDNISETANSDMSVDLNNSSGSNSDTKQTTETIKTSIPTESVQTHEDIDIHVSSDSYLHTEPSSTHSPLELVTLQRNATTQPNVLRNTTETDIVNVTEQVDVTEPININTTIENENYNVTDSVSRDKNITSAQNRTETLTESEIWNVTEKIEIDGYSTTKSNIIESAYASESDKSNVTEPDQMYDDITTKPTIVDTATEGDIHKDTHVAWNIRFLPLTIQPVHYKLHLDIYVLSTSGLCRDSGLYTGSVTMTIRVINTTDCIVFHANDLRLNADRIFIRQNNESVDQHIEDVTYNHVFGYYVIKLTDFLDEGIYDVTIPNFMGCITTSSGLFLSSYATASGETRYLVASQLQATDARKVFPCFDEPAMKATFSVSITHGEEYTALGNMPVRTTQCVGDCSRRKVTFEDTPIMSTYLLAFVVSDFKYTESILPGNYTLRVWSQPEMINQTLYALNFAVRTYDYFTDYFQITDVVHKSDHVAVPDFSGGAMENWGLVIYRETALLYDPYVSSSSNKFMVTLIVAHEIAHTWFGNMVTMKWWDDLWLNEGFASTLMYFAMDNAYPDWNIPDMIVVEDMFPVMVKDALETSHPVSPDSLDNPYDIGESFDPISYNKGMAVLRMLETFLGRDVFRLGLQMYVTEYKFKNAEMSELWETFRQASNNTFNISEIMDTWTRQMGYPVITVHEEGNQFVLEQTRFLISTNSSTHYNDSIFGYKWYVPFRYRTEDDPDVKLHWLNMGPGVIPKTSEGWLLGNVDYDGFFRTNYDLNMWRKLTHQLNYNHTVLSGANRAGLIGDAFNLARASMLDYAVAFNLTTYLHQEQRYVPWKGFLEELQFIREMLSKQSAYVLLEKYLRQLIRPVLMTIGIRETDSLPDMYLRRMLLRTGCDVGVEEAIQYAKDKFNEWRFNETRLPTDFAQVIYAVGVREGSVEEWDYLWIKSRLTNSPSEREMMLEALAHTQKPWLLWRYANWIFDEDKIKLQDVRLVMSYFSNTPLGRMIALHFLMNRWDDLNKQFGSDTFIIREMIGEVTANVNTDFELQQLHLLFTKKPPKGARNGADSALALIRANINWMSLNYEPISNWLKQHVDSSF